MAQDRLVNRLRRPNPRKDRSEGAAFIPAEARACGASVVLGGQEPGVLSLVLAEVELEVESAESKFASASGILDSINPDWLEP